MILRVTALFLAGMLGVWLAYWDLSNFLTQGLNTGVWEVSIVVNGFPSIATGICIIIVVIALGVNVIVKG